MNERKQSKNKKLTKLNYKNVPYLRLSLYRITMQEVWTEHGVYVLNRVFVRGIPSKVRLAYVYLGKRVRLG